ncbi:MAG: hypothetical protein ACTSPV_00475 [Candidatus Hodarchaeales archaeon]
MNDEELIELIATIWLKNGGDKFGFELLSSRIAERIEELEKEEGDG